MLPDKETLSGKLFWLLFLVWIVAWLFTANGCNMNQVPHDPEIGTRPPTVSMESVVEERFLLIQNHTWHPLLVSVVCQDADGREDPVIYGIYVEPWGRTSYRWLRDTTCHLNTWRVTEPRQ